MLNNKKILAVGALALCAILVIFLVVSGQKGKTAVDTAEETDNATSTPPVTDPTDTALEFYNSLLAQASSGDIYTSEVYKNAPLTEDARAQIEASRIGAAVDPIFCQESVPPKIVIGKSFYSLPTETQLPVIARGTATKSVRQAIVTITAVDGVWKISKIACANGEVAPEQEYPFMNEGFLLKSVPPPYTAGNWHIVYEQDGKMGYVAPLFFDESSICISYDNSEATCNLDNLREAMKVSVSAEMTEAGANVKRLQYLAE